jgi:hypothetical protein
MLDCVCGGLALAPIQDWIDGIWLVLAETSNYLTTLVANAVHMRAIDMVDLPAWELDLTWLLLNLASAS